MSLRGIKTPSPAVISRLIQTGNFRRQRSLAGNSLGNSHWLDSTENRSRQHGKSESLGTEADFVTGGESEWNSLSPGVEGPQK